MNRAAHEVFILLSVILLASCASQGAFEQGRSYHQAEQYPEAIEHYSQAIQDSSQSNRELFRAYYYRAKANQELGKLEKAFQDFYAAKIVSCYLDTHEKTVGGGYAAGMIPSNYCAEWGDRDMQSVSSEISPERLAHLKEQVETSLSGFLEEDI